MAPCCRPFRTAAFSSVRLAGRTVSGKGGCRADFEDFCRFAVPPSLLARADEVIE
jgi:hypothetical protein